MEHKMKQKIESAVSQAMVKFLKVQMGEETETVITQVMGDIVIVKVKGILPPAERHMVRNQQGQRLIKDMKGRLIEKAKPLLEAMIKDLTDLEVVDIQSSFDVNTDEYIEVFKLDLDKTLAG